MRRIRLSACYPLLQGYAGVRLEGMNLGQVLPKVKKGQRMDSG